MLTCMYCGKQSVNYPMYLVREENPPQHDLRWKPIGYCCDDCHDDGKPIWIEYKALEQTK